VVPSIAHAGIRYFANLVPSVELSAGERFGLVDWLRWALAQGRRSLANIAVIYLSMVWRMISLSSRLCDPGRDAPRRERHRDALHALALGYRLAVDKVEALDRLRCLPAARRVLKILSAFFLDRLVLVAFAAVAVVGTVCLAPGYWKPGGAFALVLGAFVANAALSRGRGLASPLALRRAPELIGRILRAPFIVFGHSHRAERLALPGGSVYFNTGSWADEDVRHAFTHLVITGDEPCAELRQWRDGRSAPFSPLPDDDDEAKAPAAVAAASVSSVA
jgi:hypothetical protein